MPRVSIIVPVYNTEKYLGKCLESLINQTYSDIEIIAVDDNSQDHSLDILESYQKRYPEKLKIVQNSENKGAGASRNIALDIATGQYIGFVDSDDYVTENMYKDMLSASKQTNSDLARTPRRLKLCGIDLTFLKRNSISKTPIINPREDKSFIILEPPGVTNKLFSRELIGDNHFPENLKWEDYPFTVPLILKANQIVTVPSRNYIYNMHLKNTTLTDARRLTPKVLDIFTCSDIIGEQCLTSVNDNIKRQIEYVQMHHCLIRLKEVSGANIPLQEKKELLTMLSALIKIKYGSWQDDEIYLRQKQTNFIHGTRMTIVESLLLPDEHLPKDESVLKQLIKQKIDKNAK